MSWIALLRETLSQCARLKVCSDFKVVLCGCLGCYTGMALAPWNVLAGGKLRSDEEEERRAKSGDVGRSVSGYEWRRNEKERAMTSALAKVAEEIGAKHVTAVAIAYVMHKAPYVFPLIGARKVEQLEANVEALEIVLSPEHIKYLESIVPFELGFPFGLIVSLTRVWFRQLCLTFCFLQGDGSEYNFLMQNAAYMEKHPGPRPIVPDNS